MPLCRRLRALAVAALITGCAPAAPAPQTLHLAELSDFPGLNPIVFENANLSSDAVLWHGYLLRTDGENRLIPDLAVAVPTRANGGISADGRTITYHLRRGVRWHDGAPFAAKDVVFSFAAVMNPANNVPDRTGFDHVSDVRAVDDHTVRVRLTAPFTPFVPSVFTLGANEPYPILPAHLLAGKPNINQDAYNGAPVGLGPYKVVRWDRGARLLLEADPHYWAGAPKIPRIDIRIVPSTNTLGVEWSAGHVDLGVARTSGGRALSDAMRHAPDMRVQLKPHYQFDYVMFNTGRAPMNDERVRQAFVRAIDRETIMRQLEGDLHLPGQTDRLPGQFAYDASIDEPTYDPPLAARLLDAAGWRLGSDGTRRKNGVPLSIELLAINEIPLYANFNLIAQQQLAKLGIRTTSKSYAYNLAFAPAAEGGVYAGGKFDAALFGWQPNAVADHSYLFRCDERAPHGQNFGRICDPAIDAAAAIELRATDPAVEAAADDRITRALIAHAYVLFVGFNQEALVSRAGILGTVPSVNGSHYWNAWAWSWPQR